MTETLQHGRVRLALHCLRPGEGRPLLLLHGLGLASPSSVPDELAGWSGPVHALDFTGHGGSSVPLGGGYSPEILTADADAALAHLGEVTVLGYGLGAYVALLLAGARPAQVRGAILADGPGLGGGGPTFDVQGPSLEEGSALDGAEASSAPPDPLALSELTSDVRPPGYARLFVRQARHLTGLDRPISVCAGERPEWLEAVVAAPGVALGALPEALRRYAAATP